jgi:phenylacetic acid degradation operon negative regulatory protein
VAEGLIAGFDAGQTHTTCRLADAASGAVVAEAEGPGVCHLAAPDGDERFRTALRASLQAALDRLAGAAGRLEAAAVGASGIEAASGSQQRGLELAAATLALPPQRVLVTGDERTALRGAMGREEAGILVISGTGSIAVGRDAAGREHRCGGWGWLLDQAGSACDIGRDGLTLSLAMADGRRPATPLQSQLWQSLGLSPEDPATPQAIKARAVDPAFGAAGFAALAPVVAAAAQTGDPDAAAILDRSAEALAEMVAAISRTLRLEAPPVWPAGGALRHLAGLRHRLVAALAHTCPGAHLADPAGDGCDGAIALALTLRPDSGKSRC